MGLTMASCRAYITMKGTMVPGVSAGSNHVGAKEVCTPQVSCPPGWAPPAEPEGKTAELASTAEIFRISRRLRSPMEWIAILGPFQQRTGRQYIVIRVAPRKGIRRTIN